MKKIYMTPEIMLVKDETATIIAASLNGVGDTGGSAILTEETVESGTDGLSRSGGSLWDDGDELE